MNLRQGHGYVSLPWFVGFASIDPSHGKGKGTLCPDHFRFDKQSFVLQLIRLFRLLPFPIAFTLARVSLQLNKERKI